MKDWNIYDILGLIAPGSVVVAAWALLHPGLGKVIFDTDLSVGAFGLFALIGYVAGNLVQAVANLIEKHYWRLRGGWPSGKNALLSRGVLSVSDFSLIESKTIQTGLSSADTVGQLESCDTKTWEAVKSRIFTWLKARELSTRIDSFNAQYGMNRGLAVAFSGCAVLVLLYQGIALWKTELILILAAGACLFRMERFGHYYAKEIYSQFIAAPIEKRD